ncbi:hypothetical protein X777_11934 [Ooceraea biroi]|uniref:Uncharacterized protein n=1 Tax=Ooceraea biroi TaxID=2015173 RepID=A0A026W1H6_OOCBI|nr:hypothetical protein X777_11934 [Ooceraea biroi]
MRAFSSKGAILRRQRDPADIARGLFNPGSRRNLSAGQSSSHVKCQTRSCNHAACHKISRDAAIPRTIFIFDIRAFCAASILHADGRTAGGREGFFTWLKDIFNKSAEDRRSHIVDRAAVATQLDHPEIAVSKRPAGSSRKVDVVNQAPVNFGAARSTATLEDDGHFHVAEHHAENGIEMTSRSSPCCTTTEREKTSGRDSNPNPLWFDSDEVYRPEGNGAEHPRSYASPRHCYRVPPRHPLLGSVILNRNVPTRAIAAFASGNSRPPIKEPKTTPENRDKKKDERKDREEKKKKPVIRTDDGPADNSENRVAMVADDNSTGDPETAFRYEWGVKLAEGPATYLSEPGDSDNVIEKDQRYVTKRLWGVNLRQPRSDAENAATTTSKGFEGDAGKQVQNASSIPGDTDEMKSDETLMEAVEPVAASDLKSTTAEYLSTPSNRSDSVSASGTDNLITAQREANDANFSLNDLRKLQETISPSTQAETIAIDDDYNIPADAASDAEIVAWKNLVMKSRTIVPEREDFLSADRVENLQMVSIRPEAPQPKLDVRVVRSIEDTSKDESADHSDSESVISGEFKRPDSADARKFDNYSPSKKLHTASWQIRYAHRDTRSVIQCCDELLPIVRQQADAKGQGSKGDGECSDFNASNSLDNQRSVSPVESQRFLNNGKEADINLIKTLNTISNGETTISSNQSLIRDADPSEITQPSTLASLAKDESYVEDENAHCETERRKDYKDVFDDATYIDSDNPSTNGGQLDAMIDSKAAGKNPRGRILRLEDDHDSDSTKERSDDSSKEHIVDDDYVRLPGDPYPYNKEHLDKWYNVPHSKNFSYKPIKRGASHPHSPTLEKSSEASAADFHGGMIATETSVSGFRVFLQKQRMPSDNCSQKDAADALELQRWTEDFSRLEGGGKASEATRVGDDNASLRAYRR